MANEHNFTEIIETIFSINETELSFENWYNLNENEILLELAENGADRELDFDIEKEFEKRYERYLAIIEEQNDYEKYGEYKLDKNENCHVHKVLKYE